MSRNFSLGVVLIVFTLLEGIVVAPEGETSTSTSTATRNSGSLSKAAGKAASKAASSVGKALWAKIGPWKLITKWRGVTFQVKGRNPEKGKLKACKNANGEGLFFRFYPETWRKEVKFIFKKKNMVNITRNGAVINAVIDRTECILTFPSASDAEAFLALQ